MEGRPVARDERHSTEKIYTRKEVTEMLRDKAREAHLLREDLKEAFTEILLLKKEVEELKRSLQNHETPSDGYRKEWTWVRKIVFVLEHAEKAMRSPEIIEVLAKREEHLRNHWNQAKYFSAFLNKAVKDERIGREKRRGERGYYYFLLR